MELTHQDNPLSGIVDGIVLHETNTAIHITWIRYAILKY